MRKNTLVRSLGFLGAVGVSAALVGAAATGTGAYFSDKVDGKVTGTMGSIDIVGDKTQLVFENMLPGTGATDTATFRNTGKNVQDVWVVFDQTAIGDGTAKTGLNSLGRFAEVHIKGNGTPVFDSANLNDNAASCPPAGTDCNPLPRVLKLKDDLAAGAVGSMEFTFVPSARFKGVENAALLNLPFTIVATQDGIAPSDVLNSTVVS